jgi:hypothetical protein
MNSTQGYNRNNSSYGRSNKHAALAEWQKRKLQGPTSWSNKDDEYDQTSVDRYSTLEVNTLIPFSFSNKFATGVALTEEDKWLESKFEISPNLVDSDSKSTTVMTTETAKAPINQSENLLLVDSLFSFNMSDDDESTIGNEIVSVSCWDSDGGDSTQLQSEYPLTLNESARLVKSCSKHRREDRKGTSSPRNTKVGPDSKQMKVVYRMLEYLKTNKDMDKDYRMYLTEIDLIVKQCSELHLIHIREYRHLPGVIFDRIVMKLGGEAFLRIYMASKSFEFSFYLVGK